MIILLISGTEIMPKSTPTRIIAMFWWLFCLICVSSYTANLAAFLTKSKMKPKINSADDLARQTGITYGCYGMGSTREFFRVGLCMLTLWNTWTYSIFAEILLWLFVSVNIGILYVLVQGCSTFSWWGPTLRIVYRLGATSIPT